MFLYLRILHKISLSSCAMIEGDTALYPLSQPPLQLGTWTWLCRSYSTLCPLLPTPQCPQSHTVVALEASDIKKHKPYTMHSGDGGSCIYYLQLVVSERQAVLGISTGPGLCCDLAGGPAWMSPKPASLAYPEILWVINTIVMNPLSA